jgi:single-stranded DNA-binding protein
MSSFNRTLIIGRVDCKPELKRKGNMEYADFNIITTVTSGDKTENMAHPVRCYSRQAVLCNENLDKGDLCCVEGRLNDGNYEDKLKQIIAEKVVFLRKK